MRYVGIQQEHGHVVDESEAYAYALQRVLADENEQKEFVEWFYSGNWVTEDDDNE